MRLTHPAFHATALAALLIVVSSCASGSEPTANVASSTSPPVTTAATSSSAISTSAKPSTTAARDVLDSLCASHCAELERVNDLPTCKVADAACSAQVRQADRAITALRQDMIDQGINREDSINLDDALTASQEAIDDYNLFTCSGTADISQADEFACAIEALSVKTTVGTVGITLGSMRAPSSVAARTS